MKYYIVVFDRVPTGRYREFHNEFVGHQGVRRWWHFVKSSYIIGTDLGPSELSAHFRATAANYDLPERHLVLKVDLRNRQGWLPNDAWEWIRRHASEQDEA
jgi:hypothetical protein